ncbi:MAG: ketol-acid reductoisomerase [Candidatus Omnitrophica bacterium]|nr:ketol-acid reductoisomerase [Candidatus Omnitrophota bacterium]MCF7877010.1 ketol-acid reductoisomerase [Candidatus Omnitrophota bacterium]MCF7878351.1 ketol-acid reductoisomerase [Candidatus Omnitrophota bacterium]MCF7893025.1 ketol-acid reductoisomerase [Candidatus Omnitrophota bacterium]
MAKVYYEKDLKTNSLTKKRVAVIGYGAQGRAQALNLRDSKVKVVVAELKGTDNYKQAKKDGFDPLDAAEAAKKADIIHILTPDTVQAKVYKEQIEPNLKKGNALGFSHGFNIHFHQIVPPAGIDVYMVAPKGPGTLVREMYEANQGVPCLVAVYQDATKGAKKIALSYAKAIGGMKAGVLETTFCEETETDLFGEQVVLCGGVTKLIQKGFETLVEAGYQPEIAYFECLHELKLITDLVYKQGIGGMRKVVSDTAEYGDLTRGRRVINDKVKDEMKKILGEIQSGEFSREWILENQAKRPVYKALKKKEEEHLIEKIGKKLRKMMPWIK